MADRDYEKYHEDGTWYVVNHTKWGNKILAEISGPGAKEWADKYYRWLDGRCSSSPPCNNMLGTRPHVCNWDR